MKTRTRMDGRIQIEYEARQHPRLFAPFNQQAGSRMPTEEVEKWLHDHHTTWWISNYSFMCITFKSPSTAALFKLTFA